jgi:chaperone modulatory protein CbpM
MKIIRFSEACELCGVNTELVIHFIEEDWIRPADEHFMELDEEDLARIRLIHQLQQDFGVNDEGVSIILPLLDQLNRMHLEIEKNSLEAPHRI